VRPDVNLLVPSTAPGTNQTRPAFWVIKKKGLLTDSHVTRMLDALEEAFRLGCKPHIHGAERSDGFSAFHAGAFFKPCATKTIPWVSNDVLQPPTSSGRKSQAQATRRMTAMVNLCLAIDSVLNTRGQSVLKKHDPKALTRSRRLHQSIRQQGQEEIDFGRLANAPSIQPDTKELTSVLRFGNLGTCVAIGRGQSEKLHLDLNDNNSLYTSIMVLGDKSDPWDDSRNQGSLYLPTLGMIIPMRIGDMVFFNASELPHLAIKLNPVEREKRTVITTFTCAHLSEVLEHPPAFCLPWMPL
jgi:hypothetical protein